MTVGAVDQRIKLREGSVELARYRMVNALVLVLIIGLTLSSFGPFALGVITRGIGMGIAVMGVNLAAGHTGQPAFGHGAFMGVGAYAAAFAFSDLGLPLAGALAVSFLAPMLPGAIIGLAASRIKGVYLSIVTLSMAAGFPSLVKAAQPVTNGVGGFRIENIGSAPGWTGLDRDAHWVFLLTSVLAVLAAVAGRGILSSRVGRAMTALREGPAAAKVFGISPPRMLAAVYATSAGFAGLGGLIAALPLEFIAPDDYRLFLSLQLFAAMVIGGIRSIPGSVLGGVVVATLPWVAFGLHLPIGSDLVVAAAVLMLSQVLRGGVAGAARRLEARLVCYTPVVPELIPFWAGSGPRRPDPVPMLGDLTGEIGDDSRWAADPGATVERDPIHPAQP